MGAAAVGGARYVGVVQHGVLRRVQRPRVARLLSQTTHLNLRTQHSVQIGTARKTSLGRSQLHRRRFAAPPQQSALACGTGSQRMAHGIQWDGKTFDYRCADGRQCSTDGR